MTLGGGAQAQLLPAFSMLLISFPVKPNRSMTEQSLW
jgi:hypothetical protein